MSRRTPNFARVFATGSFEGAEKEAVLELAFMMANANGDAVNSWLTQARGTFFF